jgi:hypothetical protein
MRTVFDSCHTTRRPQNKISQDLLISTFALLWAASFEIVPFNILRKPSPESLDWILGHIPFTNLTCAPLVRYQQPRQCYLACSDRHAQSRPYEHEELLQWIIRLSYLLKVWRVYRVKRRGEDSC